MNLSKGDCRCCMKNGDFGNMLHVNYNKKRLSEILESCTGVQIHVKNDSLPKGICESCLNTLLSIHKFKIRSNKIQRNMYEEINSSLVEIIGGLKNRHGTDLCSEIEIDDDGRIWRIRSGGAVNIPVPDEPFSNEDKIIVLDLKNESVDDENDFIIKPFECNFCRDSFMKYPEFLVHYQENHSCKNNDPFAKKKRNAPNIKRKGISGCTESFNQDPVVKEAFPCQRCAKTFNSPGDLLSHVQDSASECSYCGKKFAFRKSVKFHELIHKQLKPFACQICEKQFRQKSHLNYHLRTHSGEKPYHCRWCDRSFSYSRSLKTHNCSVLFQSEEVCDY